jgi:plasmid stability protein
MQPSLKWCGATMASLTVKNIPADLYEHLKQAAKAHRRSINSELIVCLERVLLPNKLPPDERLSIARVLRKRVNTSIINVADIDAAKNEGRP